MGQGAKRIGLGLAVVAMGWVSPEGVQPAAAQLPAARSPHASRAEPHPGRLRSWRAVASGGVHASIRRQGAMWTQLERAWYEEPAYGPTAGVRVAHRVQPWLHVGGAVRWGRLRMERLGRPGAAQLDRLGWMAVARPHATFSFAEIFRSHTELGGELGVGWVREWWLLQGTAATADALRLSVALSFAWIIGPVELSPRIGLARTFVGEVGRFGLSTDQTVFLLDFHAGVRW